MPTATFWGSGMMALPSVPEVLGWLELLSEDGYSAEARRRASDWATPLLIEAGTPFVTEPPALGQALFLLGAADLLANLADFLYQNADFEQARRELSNE